MVTEDMKKGKWRGGQGCAMRKQAGLVGDQDFRDAGCQGREERRHASQRTHPATSGASESEANSENEADVRAVSHEAA